LSEIEKKLKHLEFIQLTIIRMAANSFLIKAWSVTIVAALFAISVGGTKDYLLIAYLPLISFWILDAYYLRQEKLYRGLYDSVRNTAEKDITFSLNTADVKNVENWFQVCRSTTIELFYGPILLVLMIATAVLVINQWR